MKFWTSIVYIKNNISQEEEIKYINFVKNYWNYISKKDFISIVKKLFKKCILLY